MHNAGRLLAECPEVQSNKINYADGQDEGNGPNNFDFQSPSRSRSCKKRFPYNRGVKGDRQLGKKSSRWF
jgi:hypothetical protein